MRDGLKPFGDATADALRRRISTDEVWMIGLELLQLAQQLVELSVADLGLVRDVVPLFVMSKLATEFCDARRGIHSRNSKFKMQNANSVFAF